MATASIEQIQGCLLGLAVADAVGAPWEGMPPDLVFETGPAAEIVKHESGRKLHYTDDTQMMIGVAEALLEAGTIDVEILAHRFAANYDPNRGYGQGTRKIINAIGFGEDWRTLAKTIFDGEGSLGNGAAMRVAPLGVVFSDSIDEVVAQARRSAEPTHTHPIGVDSAAVMAVAAALAVRDANSDFDRHAFFESLLPHAATEEFQSQIRHAQQLEPFQSLVAFGNSLRAHQSVMTSIVCFADSPDDYPAAIARAIGQGNDVDTLAAMTGALTGARLGMQSIPTNLLDCLEDDDKGRSYLMWLADQLFGFANQLDS